MFCLILLEIKRTIREPGCGLAWLWRLLWEQDIGGSNPPIPTILYERDISIASECLFLYISSKKCKRKCFAGIKNRTSELFVGSSFFHIPRHEFV